MAWVFQPEGLGVKRDSVLAAGRTSWKPSEFSYPEFRWDFLEVAGLAIPKADLLIGAQPCLGGADGQIG